MARKADIVHMDHQSHSVTVQAVIPTRNNGVLVSRLLARHHPGTRPSLHRPTGGDLRRHDHRRKRPSGKGISLAPPLKMSLERALEYIAPDEYVEATPKSLRMRKKILDANARKRSAQKLA